MNKREAFVNMALEYHGVNEADGSHKLIIDLYNSIKPLPVGYRLSYSDPWCAAFVSVVSKRCGLLDVVFPECSCPRMVELYKQAGRWQEDDNYIAKPGDIVFYSWSDLNGGGDCTLPPDHVGIVVNSSGVTMKVVEGNLSDAVQYRNLVVGARYIRGFGLPDFEGEAATVENKSEVSAEDTESALQKRSVELPVLCKGMAGNGVRALQLLLIGAGCSVGPDGADGEFGNNTEQAVKACQEKNGLGVDGIAGQATWSVLLKQ